MPTRVGQGEQNAVVVGCPERQHGGDRATDEETNSPALSHYSGGRQFEEMEEACTRRAGADDGFTASRRGLSGTGS